MKILNFEINQGRGSTEPLNVHFVLDIVKPAAKVYGLVGYCKNFTQLEIGVLNAKWTLKCSA